MVQMGHFDAVPLIYKRDGSISLKQDFHIVIAFIRSHHDFTVCPGEGIGEGKT
jgi:hypothetical protein